MNDLLELKGRLESSKYKGPINYSIAKSKEVKSDDLIKLKKDLERLNEFWKDKTIIPGALVSVYYNRVIPKSSRLKGFFSIGSEPSNNYVRGVRFSDIKNKKHIITYYIDKKTLNKSIERINILIDIINNGFDGVINSENFSLIDKKETLLKKHNMVKSAFKKYVTDLIDIEKFDVYENGDVIDEVKSYITIFDTGINIVELMNRIGLKNTEYEVFSNDTIYVNNSSILFKIRQNASYLVSMAMTDFATYYQETENKIDTNINFLDMPLPTSEPTIGVIDTLFDENVYFSKWVDYTDCLNKDMPREAEDYVHGTEVSSIIVDGARTNTKWDDECGLFKVRHFGVAKAGVNNSYDIINQIKRIVKENKDIHVWNISLGSKFEISQNYISPEAAALDEIQYENNVIFVVAGTNKKNSKEIVRIGAPADSINSLVVNAVDKNGDKASYARKGKVLSFFVKPDVCAFGGDTNEYINVCTPTGLDIQRGTSFAAPWISRKLSYLIDKMNLSREIAKALIIDSAVGWNKTNKDEEYLGYGVVPTKISEVMLGQKDEIKFYIEGNANSYYTYTYNLPVPVVNEKFPFYAKAVLCYFPKCTRSQGVDYTNTELDLQFGRMGVKDIRSINRNTQGGELDRATNEATARELYRKWDNVKIVVDEIKDTKVPRKSFNSNLWGIKLTNKERLERDRGLKFGVVITLKEMFGKNRMQEFIDQCTMRNWIVNRVNIENRLDIYASAEEIIKFE